MADINLAVLVGMIDKSDRETQNELTGALMEFIRAQKDLTDNRLNQTADHTHKHTRNKSIAQRVKAQVIKKHKADIGEVPKQIYNNYKFPDCCLLLL